VLLSQATRDQVAKELVAGAGLRELGRHRLKDLPRREELYQLVLPGLPADYPPLLTLDAWPGLRADLVVVALLATGLLAIVGLLLPATSSLARPVRRALTTQWRDARKPFAAITSALLSLVVVVTTLFVTKPPIFLRPAHLGYDFSYTYHAPTKRGGTVTIGLWGPLRTLAVFLVHDQLAFSRIGSGSVRWGSWGQP